MNSVDVQLMAFGAVVTFAREDKEDISIRMNNQTMGQLLDRLNEADVNREGFDLITLPAKDVQADDIIAGSLRVTRVTNRIEDDGAKMTEIFLDRLGTLHVFQSTTLEVRRAIQ